MSLQSSPIELILGKSMTSSLLPMVPAPLWRRIIAMIYDSLVLLAISMAYGGLATALLVAKNGADQQQYLPMSDGHAFLVGWLLTLLLFHIFFWHRGGQTLGMKAWRIKIVDHDGGPLSVTQCCVRFFTAMLSLGLFGLGYVWGLFNASKACWHDLASNSQTVFIGASKKATRSDVSKPHQ